MYKGLQQIVNGFVQHELWFIVLRASVFSPRTHLFVARISVLSIRRTVLSAGAALLLTGNSVWRERRPVFTP